MAHFVDLSPFDHLPLGQQVQAKAVGWLDAGHDYARGRVPMDFVRALCALLVDPWQPVVTAGRHPCSLCRLSGGPSAVHLEGVQLSIGSANLLVPGEGAVYVAPSTIIHYVDAHEYAPSEEFQRAVLACPPMRSVAYLKALRSCGVSLR